MAAEYPHLIFAFGIVGNFVAFMVFLSPMGVFWDVYKNKTTGEFQSLPYVVGLFSSMLWIYYATLKGVTMLMIFIRSVGIIIQTFYLCVFVFYAPKKPRMESLKLILLFIVIGFGLIVILTQVLTKGDQRVVIVGRVFLVLSSLCAFFAPVGVMTQVFKTKGVEYMPTLRVLSVTTLNGLIWFFYGLLLKDFNIVIPNALGFTLGVIQIIVSFVYKKEKPNIDNNINENKEEISGIDEQKVIDQNTTDTVIMLNTSIDSENVENPHGVDVFPSQIVANHTIEV